MHRVKTHQHYSNELKVYIQENNIKIPKAICRKRGAKVLMALTGLNPSKRQSSL
jgi:hypothetical protein